MLLVLSEYSEVSDITAAAKEHCLLGLPGVHRQRHQAIHPGIAPSSGRLQSGSAGQGGQWTEQKAPQQGAPQQGVPQQGAQQQGATQQRAMQHGAPQQGMQGVQQQAAEQQQAA